MHGIIDKATGKVYAKSKKHDSKFEKLLKQVERAYPDRWFMISDVDDNAELVGDLDKTVERKRF